MLRNIAIVSEHLSLPPQRPQCWLPACLVLLLTLPTPLVQAEEAEPAAAPAAPGGDIRYVKDVIYINLRAGPGGQDPTVAVIPSGVRMEILDPDKVDDTYHVRLLSGKHVGSEGWVQARFLSDQPIAGEQLEAALTTITALEGKNASLEQELDKIRDGKQQQDKELTSLRRENQSLKRELKEIKEVSADALESHRQRQLLEQRLTEQATRLQTAEAVSAAAEEKLYMVVIGAALLALGVGFYIGYTPVRRQNRWRKMS